MKSQTKCLSIMCLNALHGLMNQRTLDNLRLCGWCWHQFHEYKRFPTCPVSNTW